MSLYGFKEMLDNRVASIIVAAHDYDFYSQWSDTVMSQTNGNFNEIYMSRMMDALRNPVFKGFKKPVLAFYHDNEEQRNAFWEEWDISEVKTQRARDLHLDMLHSNKLKLEASLPEEETNKTIAEIHGLDEHDPWDKRSEEEKEHDLKMKERIKKLQESGEMSSDSFAGAEEQKSAKQGEEAVARVTNVKASVDENGKVTVNSVTAHKHEGPVDEELKEAREEEAQETKKKRRVFSPKDFAAVLKGDGSSSVLTGHNVKPGAKVEAPVLSPEAEEARKEYQDNLAEQRRRNREQARKEADIKARGERDNGIFKGSDLGYDTDLTSLEDLPEDVQTCINEISEHYEIEISEVEVKNYPYNSELAGRCLLPFDTIKTNLANKTLIIDYVNLTSEGVITMGDSSVSIVKKTNGNEDGWAIYGTAGEDGSINKIDVIRIR